MNDRPEWKMKCLSTKNNCAPSCDFKHPLESRLNIHILIVNPWNNRQLVSDHLWCYLMLPQSGCKYISSFIMTPHSLCDAQHQPCPWPFFIGLGSSSIIPDDWKLPTEECCKFTQRRETLTSSSMLTSASLCMFVLENPAFSLYIWDSVTCTGNVTVPADIQHTVSQSVHETETEL